MIINANQVIIKIGYHRFYLLVHFESGKAHKAEPQSEDEGACTHQHFKRFIHSHHDLLHGK